MPIAAPQSRRPFSVAGRVRELYCLFNILNGDQALEVAFFIHQRQLFDLVLAEDRLCFFHSRAYRSRDQVILGHYFRDRAVIVGQEPHVAVGDDAHQLAHIVYDRHAGDLVLALSERWHQIPDDFPSGRTG